MRPLPSAQMQGANALDHDPIKLNRIMV